MSTVTYPPIKQQYYAPPAKVDTHSKAVGYLFWLVGFTGAHRFFYGKPISGFIWFCTAGLFGIGWLVDAFLIPSMDREADGRFAVGHLDFNVTWILLLLVGVLGVHRFYQCKVFTGLLYLLTCGVFGFGIIYDVLTLNEQLDEQHS